MSAGLIVRIMHVASSSIHYKPVTLLHRHPYPCSLIRWLVIPKLNDNLKLLRAMIVGLALCEGSGFMQIFLLGKEYPDTQKLIFVLAVLGVVQFAPTYFKKA